MGVLTDYFEAAMRHALTDRLADGSWCVRVEPCPGAWGTGPTEHAAFQEARDVLEEWVLLGLVHGDPLPTIDGQTLQMTMQNL